MQTSTTTYAVSTNRWVTQGDAVIYSDIIYIKGQTAFELDLTGIDETAKKVKSVTIDWDDGSPTETYNIGLVKNYYNESVINEFLTGVDQTVCSDYLHTYYPLQSSYLVERTCKAIVTFLANEQSLLSQSTLEIYVPLRISQTSYYDSVEELFLINNQLLPLSSSNTLLNVQTLNSRYTIPVITDTTLSGSAVSTLTSFSTSNFSTSITPLSDLYTLYDVTIVTNFDGDYNITPAETIRPNVPRSLYPTIGIVDPLVVSVTDEYQVGVYENGSTSWGAYKFYDDGSVHTIRLTTLSGAFNSAQIISNTCGVGIISLTSPVSSTYDIQITTPQSNGTLFIRYSKT
jgi:hypothetical protein